jgi:hypothetical protein
MKVAKWALFGGVAGAIGAAIWAAVALTTHYESGWVAWGIGLLVGLAVRMASHKDEGSGFFPGIVAVMLAILAIVAGKYAAVHFMIEQAVGNAAVDPKKPGPTDADMIANIADEVVDEFEEAKKPLNWPPGVNPEDAHKPEEFPKEVWTEAKARWESKPAAERETLKSRAKQQGAVLLNNVKDQIRQEAFKQSFGLYDIIFFLLAVATAFKVGSGNSGSG